MSRTAFPLQPSPFRLQVPPAEAVEHRAWRHARVAVVDALERGETVALLGPPGSGKTLMLKAIGASLEAMGWRVAFARPETIASVPDEAEIVLVDEAGGLSDQDLPALAGQARALVLAGLPDLGGRLDSLPRPVARVVLGPMTPEDVSRLVVARLITAGRPRDLFDAEALRALAHHSRGVARLVLVLAGAALFTAESDGAARVTAEAVRDAAAMRSGGLEPEEEVVASAVPAPVAPAPARVRLAGHGPERRRVSRTRLWWRRATLGLAATGLAMAAGAVALAPPSALRRIWAGAPQVARVDPPQAMGPMAPVEPHPDMAHPADQAPPAEPATVPVPAPAPLPATDAMPAPERPPEAPKPPAARGAPQPRRVAATPPPVPVPHSQDTRPAAPAPAAPGPAPAPARLPPIPGVAAEVPQSPWWVDRAVPDAQGREEVRVVTREPANIRRAPGLASAVVRVTSAGMVLRVFAQRGPWVQVGDSAPWGWVHTAVVERAS